MLISPEQTLLYLVYTQFNILLQRREGKTTSLWSAKASTTNNQIRYTAGKWKIMYLAKFNHLYALQKNENSSKFS